MDDTEKLRVAAATCFGGMAKHDFDENIEPIMGSSGRLLASLETLVDYASRTSKHEAVTNLVTKLPELRSRIADWDLRWLNRGFSSPEEEARQERENRDLGLHMLLAVREECLKV